MADAQIVQCLKPFDEVTITTCCMFAVLEKSKMYDASPQENVCKDELTGTHRIVRAILAEKFRNLVCSLYASVSWLEFEINEFNFEHRTEELADGRMIQHAAYVSERICPVHGKDVLKHDDVGLRLFNATELQLWWKVFIPVQIFVVAVYQLNVCQTSTGCVKHVVVIVDQLRKRAELLEKHATRHGARW